LTGKVSNLGHVRKVAAYGAMDNRSAWGTYGKGEGRKEPV